MVLLILIHESLNRIVIVCQVHNYLKIILKAWRKNAGHLIRNRVLIALGEIRPELLLILETPVLVRHFVEPLYKSRVRLWIKVEGFLPQRFRSNLLPIYLFLLYVADLTATGIITFVIV